MRALHSECSGLCENVVSANVYDKLRGKTELLPTSKQLMGYDTRSQLDYFTADVSADDNAETGF